MPSDPPTLDLAAPQEETLGGTVERIVYASEDDGWAVVRLAVPERRQPVTAVGNLPGVQPGETLELRGGWTRDRRYGEQFRVRSYRSVAPATVTGIERYLGSGLIQGIGPTLAKRLVERFGLETLEVIDHQPQRLAEVEGIGPVRLERIQAAWQEQREVREVMVFLQSRGVSTGQAARIYKEYGSEAIPLLRENPYRLASDVHGIGFKTADRIAADLGFAPESPQRAAAGVLHTLERAADSGHLFLPEGRLLEEAASLLELPQEVARRGLARLLEEGLAMAERPGGTGGRAIYLAPLHAAETGLAARLSTLLAAPLPPLEIDEERALAWFAGRQRMALAPEQRQAIRRALRSKLLVITGGPGTGKTTLVRGVVEILRRKGREVLLAAPTGRAAQRLAEATGMAAKTVHRLLEFDPQRLAFQRGPERPLAAELVLIDEASMLDVPLAHHLLRAIPDAARLVLVGDVDQLPPVGPGKFLEDLIRSGRAEVARLEKVFRQAALSRIVLNAHRVRRGELPVLDVEEGEVSDFYFIEREDAAEALQTIRHLVTERIPSGFGLDPMREIQVLTPMHRGELGASRLNAELQSLLNPQGRPVGSGGGALRVGDKVMQVRNNYELEVFNGDLGQVEAVDLAAQRVRVRFDAGVVDYGLRQLDELTLAYACSVHKSQGSEYPCVVLPLHTQHYVMLQRNLLYTAITRARRLMILVGSRRALALAVRNRRIQHRYSRLAELLAGGAEPQG